MRAVTIGRALGLVALVSVGLGCAAEGDDAATDETTEAPAPDAAEASAPAPAPGVSGEADEIDDVRMAECAADTVGMVARLDVINDSSKRSSYSIDVVFEGADGAQLATGFSFVNNLEPGQTTQTEAHSLTSADGREFTCRLVSVDRMAAA